MKDYKQLKALITKLEKKQKELIKINNQKNKLEKEIKELENKIQSILNENKTSNFSPIN